MAVRSPGCFPLVAWVVFRGFGEQRPAGRLRGRCPIPFPECWGGSRAIWYRRLEAAGSAQALLNSCEKEKAVKLRACRPEPGARSHSPWPAAVPGPADGAGGVHPLPACPARLRLSGVMHSAGGRDLELCGEGAAHRVSILFPSLCLWFSWRRGTSGHSGSGSSSLVCGAQQPHSPSLVPSVMSRNNWST